MSVYECDHAPHDDPRFPNSCRKCGRLLTRRDRQYEDAFLQAAADMAATQFGTQTQEFVASVQRRLEVGQERYGDRSLKRPLAELRRELLEECWDIGAWGALAAQRQPLGEFEDDDAAWHLHQAVVHAAAADWHLRRFVGD
jgi:hypothetical protein